MQKMKKILKYPKISVEKGKNDDRRQTQPLPISDFRLTILPR